MRLLIMGPPGAGKGTQAVTLAAAVGGPHISTGELFRDHAARCTGLGLLAERHMAAGEYVPDVITDDIVRERLGRADASNAFVLDGYPRTRAQVETLDATLENQGARIDGVIELVVSEDLLLSRILKRSEVSGRSDDTAAVVRRRIAVHRSQTAGLVGDYDERGILRRVDGSGSPDEVWRAIDAAVVSLRATKATASMVAPADRSN